MDDTVAVIGAGIVGTCTALELLRAGYRVEIYDSGGPGSGASFGNAGLISPDSVLPAAMPGTLQKVPGWLLDGRSGPLSIDPRYLAKAAPWLARFVGASRAAKIPALSTALRALHRDSFDLYRDLLGVGDTADLLRRNGQIQVWHAGDPTTPLMRHLWAEHGVATEPLDADALRQLAPDLAPEFSEGQFFPDNGMTVNPARLVETLFGKVVEAGGILHRERVMKLIPDEVGPWRILTNLGDRRAGKIVVTGGAWSKTLLAPLGIAPPLDTERGYHVMFSAPGIDLRLPMVHRGFGIGITPMEHGLRVTGRVEIAGLEKAPDERQSEIVLAHARRLFPTLDTEARSVWMGFRPSMPDSLPVIDRVARHPGLFMAFGHGHFGMTAAPATARAVRSMVRGNTPQIDLAPYALSRF